MYPPFRFRPGGRSRRRRLLALLALPALLVTLATPGTGVAQPAESDPLEPESRFEATVEQAVTDEVEERGASDFWVVFDEQADLSGANDIADWGERGQFVYDRLTTTAAASQEELIEQLSADGVAHESFWIANAVLVRGGDEATLNLVRSEAGIAQVRADEPVELPDPIDDDTADTGNGARVNAVEWGIANIRAHRVWETFNVRGEGIVVGNIDTGVEYEHPALIEQYRGNIGGEVFDHNYNWWDPSQVCGNPSVEPCDNHGHGTHTIGTMVGDDGADNQVGVAPGATWLAAKGCESRTCSQGALLSSGQFMLAPTDLNGADPRPELRPHVVNNSWGRGGEDAFFDDVVAAWVAAGMFPVFSNGNSGPTCDTAGSPADGPQAYGVGAYDSNNEIGSFSSRGPGRGDSIRPNISAPGVAVRSSYPEGRYATADGTSMAAPHVAGTAALILSAAPDVVGDVTEIRRLLDETATDTEDLQCGGTPEHNNVYGEGRLDAFAAVDLSPWTTKGSLNGTVTDSSGEGLAGVTVGLEGSGRTRLARTDADGSYTVEGLPTGTYDVTATLFGHRSESGAAVIVADESASLDFQLAAVPSHPVSGTVLDDEGAPLAGAIVTIAATPLPPVTTGEDGQFGFDSVPEGQYRVDARSHGCFDPATINLTVDGAETREITLQQYRDDHGYTCRTEPANYIEASESTEAHERIWASWNNSFQRGLSVDLPFVFPFYDTAYGDSIYLTEPGYLSFVTARSTINNAPIPGFAPGSNGWPHAAVFPFWDDVVIDDQAEIFTKLVGPQGERKFVVEWRNVGLCGQEDYYEDAGQCHPADISDRVDFEAILYESGEIVLQYRNIDPETPRARGSSATVGIQNFGATDGLQFSHDVAAVSNDTAIRFSPPPGGVVAGTVTDANDKAGRGWVQVQTTSGDVVQRTETNRDGAYALRLPPGTHTLTFKRDGYAGESREVVVSSGDRQVVDVAMYTAVASVSLDEIDTTMQQGSQQTFQVDLTNTGSSALEWEPSLRAVRGPQDLEAEPGADPGTILDTWQLGVQQPGVTRGPRGIGIVGDDVWVALDDVPAGSRTEVNKQYQMDGTPTGRSLEPDWARYGTSSVGEMAFDEGRGWMCQMLRNFPAEIYCWDPATGQVVESITRRSAEPWAQQGGGGLAYDVGDDIFYVSHMGIGGFPTRHVNWKVWQVAGFSHDTPGATLNECDVTDVSYLESRPPGESPKDISQHSIAYSRTADALWMTYTDEFAIPSDTALLVDENDCSLLDVLEIDEHPVPPGLPFPILGNYFGLEVGSNGDLWLGRLPVFTHATGDGGGLARVKSVVPEFDDTSWFSVSTTPRTIEPGATQTLEVAVDTTGLYPGTYEAEVLLSTNAGRDIQVRVLLQVDVEPPDDWGQVTGSVAGLQRCDRDGGPLQHANLSLDGSRLYLEDDGSFETWVEPGSHELSVEVDGWVGESVELAIEPGESHDESFSLRHDGPCFETEPAGLELVVPEGGSTASTLAVRNAGAAALDFDIHESTIALESETVMAQPHAGPASNSDGEPAAPGGHPVADQSASFTSSGSLASTDADVGSSGEWQRGPSLNEGLGHYARAQCPGDPETFYVLSGVADMDGIPTRTPAVWQFDAASQSFSALPPMPYTSAQAQVLESATAVCADGKIHVLGGDGIAVTDNWHYVYDIANDAWSEAAATPRNVKGAAVGAWGGRIHLIGGSENLASNGQVTDRVDVYDVVSDSWVGRAEPMPVAALQSGHVQVGRHVFVVGGFSRFGPGANVNVTQRFDLVEGTWSVGPEFTSARADLALAATDTALYAIGGDADGDGTSDATDVAERLEFADWPNGEWEPVDALPAGLTGNSGGYCTQVDGQASIWSLGGALAVDGQISQLVDWTLHNDLTDESCPSDWTDVPWLSTDLDEGEIDSDDGSTVQVSVDASELELGEYTASLIVATTDPGAAAVHLPVQLSVVDDFEYLRHRVAAFEADGGMTKPGAMRLLTALDQAERHHKRGADNRAITALERFKETASDPRFVPGETARDALIADVDRLIAQFRDGSGADGGGGGSATTPARGTAVPI